jgi:hypothetical protein
MRYQRRDLDDNGFAEVWRNAQQRRCEDIYCWFATIFKNASPFRSAIIDVGTFVRAFGHRREPVLTSPPLAKAPEPRTNRITRMGDD